MTIISFQQLLLPPSYYLSTSYSSCFHSFVLLVVVLCCTHSDSCCFLCSMCTYFWSHSHLIFHNSPKFRLKYFCKFHSLLSLVSFYQECTNITCFCVGVGLLGCPVTEIMLLLHMPVQHKDIHVLN